MGSDFGEGARDNGEGGVTEANDERILVNFLLRFFVEYQHTKVKRNGKSGRTLCPRSHSRHFSLGLNV